jgi:hypothetical protein
MRSAIVVVATIIVFCAVWYGGVLQDRMRRKAAQSGVRDFLSNFNLERFRPEKPPCLSCSYWQRARSSLYLLLWTRRASFRRGRQLRRPNQHGRRTAKHSSR